MTSAVWLEDQGPTLRRITWYILIMLIEKWYTVTVVMPAMVLCGAAFRLSWVKKQAPCWGAHIFSKYWLIFDSLSLFHLAIKYYFSIVIVQIKSTATAKQARTHDIECDCAERHPGPWPTTNWSHNTAMPSLYAAVITLIIMCTMNDSTY